MIRIMLTEEVNSQQSTVVRESPILFSTEMVQAILEGRKTMTRRIVKGTPLKWLGDDIGFSPGFVENPDNYLCPYGALGDLLWVRETFAKCDDVVCFKAATYYSDGPVKFQWKPSIHMLKKDARIWLRITNIKVELLQDISIGDIHAEGINCKMESGEYHADGYGKWKDLWVKINGIESYAANPWVWAITFEVVSTTGKPA